MLLENLSQYVVFLGTLIIILELWDLQVIEFMCEYFDLFSAWALFKIF